jgi:hypothetical protein
MGFFVGSMLWVDCWAISHMGGAVWFARDIIKVGVIGTGIYIFAV